MKRHIAALQAVSRLRQAEAAEAAFEAPDAPCEPLPMTLENQLTTPEEIAEFERWCDEEDERWGRIFEQEAEAERDRYQMARLLRTRTNIHE